MIVISSGTTAQIGLATSILRTLDHMQLYTHQVGHLWTSDQFNAEIATYTTQKQHKGRTSMPSAGFETAIPAIERLQTCTSERTATGIGKGCIRVKQTLTPMYFPVFVYVCVPVCTYSYCRSYIFVPFILCFVPNTMGAVINVWKTGNSIGGISWKCWSPILQVCVRNFVSNENQTRF
jgi:hypothetical protein